MTDKLRGIEQRYGEIEARLAANETYEDPDLVSRLNKEQRELEPVVTTYRACVKRRQDLHEAESLLSDPDMKELAQEEYTAAKADIEALEEKLKILNEEFQIPITQQLDEEVSLMCNLSQGIENRGIQKGIEKGIEKGIRGAIDICRKLNLPEEEILRQIMQQYELSEDTAREYLQKEE